MKILIFGKNGQVGYELNRTLQPLGDITILDEHQADFSRPDSLRQAVKEAQPDVIVNAVAYTAVDKAEEDEALAETINATATAVLAEAAAKVGALLVHYSTDYVFDGSKDEPYVETDKANPINAYGRTKLAGEQVVQSSACDYLILRTSWVYTSRGNNFLLTILKLAKEREELNIVADQIGSPTTARLIAETSLRCIEQSMQERQAGTFKSDLYHLTTSGSTSWHEFAEEIVNIAVNINKEELAIKHIKGIPTSEYPTPAERPKNSRLNLAKIENKFELKMPSWKQALLECMDKG